MNINKIIKDILSENNSVRYNHIKDISIGGGENLSIYRDKVTGGVFGIDASIFESTTELYNPFTGENIDYDDDSLFD